MPRKRQKKRIAALDCETDPFLYGRVPKPFIWGYYDGEQYREFTDTKTCAEFLATQNAWVYAHNGGKFDFHFLLQFADRSKIRVINGRLVEFRIGKAVCRDSWNILPVPLARLSKMDFDYAKLERDVRELHKREISEYLESDCRNLHFYVTEFIERYSHSLTLAGAAFKEWRKMGGKPPRTNSRHYDRFSQWYFGGRVSPFIGGVHSGHFEILDINSAYPHAMLDEHPCAANCKFTLRPFDRELESSFLEVTCRSFGAFPLRQLDGSVDFPSDYRGRFYVTGWEFLEAIETGTIRNHRIEAAYVFDRTINFVEYVQRFYSLKNKAAVDGDHAGREFAKLFLNSLYGKFASNPARYRDYVLRDHGEDPPEGFKAGPVLGPVMICERPIAPQAQRYYDIVTAASITGWVRAYLWRSIARVETPYYCDTDSIICKNGANLPQSERLGDWELEGEANRLAIAGKKMYCVWLLPNTYQKKRYPNGTKIASKGVRLTPAEVLRVAKGHTVSYHSQAPTFSLANGVGFIDRRIRSTIKGLHNG